MELNIHLHLFEDSLEKRLDCFLASWSTEAVAVKAYAAIHAAAHRLDEEAKECLSDFLSALVGRDFDQAKEVIKYVDDFDLDRGYGSDWFQFWNTFAWRLINGHD